MSHYLAWLLFLSISLPCCAIERLPPRVLPSEQLAKYWTMTNTQLEATVPNSGRNLDLPGCAAVSFIVEKNGNTSTIKVQRVVPESDLGKVAISIATGLHFAATDFNAGKDRVFSYLIFPFNLPSDPAARQVIVNRCALGTLTWEEH